MAEKEYIEKEALQDAFKSVTEDCTCPLHIAAEIDQILDQAPAANVAEVVRGRWELVTIKYFPGQTVRVGYCQKCNEERPVDNYCPNCGARMDGDGK